MLTKKSQTQKATYCISPLIWSVQTIETDSKWVFAWGWREEGILKGGVSFWGNENALELDSGGVSTTS